MSALPFEIPETKPATEFIDGMLVQKMSPRGAHALAQGAFVQALRNWADAGGRGRVGTEWDFDLTPPGKATNRLVPDVAYVSYERIPYEDDAAAQTPTVAPNVAVEILSPGQTVTNSQTRVEIFLNCGADLVILVDYERHFAVLHDGREPTRVERDRAIEHGSLPAFSMPLERAFSNPKPR